MIQMEVAHAWSNPILLARNIPISKGVSSGSLAAWQQSRILAHIEANLEMPLLASDLARIARLSVSHFSRAFRVSIGLPPHAYVMARRIERAKRLLLADDPVPLVEIALRCGLSDQAHLSRLFRKIVGESPAAWRRNYWSPRGVNRSSATAGRAVLQQ